MGLNTNLALFLPLQHMYASSLSAKYILVCKEEHLSDKCFRKNAFRVFI